MKSFKVIFLALAVVSMMVSCGGSKKGKGGGTKKTTSLSGWKPNDSKGWFFSNKPKKVKGWPGMVFVEGGSFTMGLVKDDVMHDWNNTPQRMQVRSFFLGETEITNYEFREYVTWLKYVFSPTDQAFKEIYSGALPDTLVWKNKLSRNDIFTEDYFRAPQFDNYPVVGVSWLQAQRYCEWLTDRANEKALMDKGVISKDMYTDESQNVGDQHFNVDKYKYSDPDLDEMVDKEKIDKGLGIKTDNQRIAAVNRSSSGNLVQKFRLPTEVEWEYAALAMAANREYNAYLEKEMQIEKLKGDKGRNRGRYLANFKRGIGDYGGIGGFGNDGGVIPVDVRQFPTNEIGLYGMFGNVAEWCADVYRPIVDQEGNDFNYYRGNVYESYIEDPDGNKVQRQAESLMFDTLSDGRLVYKGLPGSYDKEVVEDARNYRDGDYQSSIEVGLFQDNDSVTENYDYYNHPNRRFRVTDDGRVILDKDEEKRQTLISDEVRVVKGGSFKDTSYWLDPGMRRFENEAGAAVWIGFRVAQDHLGDETNFKHSKRGAPTQPK